MAYLVGEFLNSLVLAKLKIATHGRCLWLRTIGSTLIGEFADSLVFITLAFMGVCRGIRSWSASHPVVRQGGL